MAPSETVAIGPRPSRPAVIAFCRRDHHPRCFAASRARLSFRDIELSLAERALSSPETIQRCCKKFGEMFVNRLLAARRGPVTSRGLTRCSSGSRARRTIFGVPWTRTASCSTPSFSPAECQGRQTFLYSCTNVIVTLASGGRPAVIYRHIGLITQRATRVSLAAKYCGPRSQPCDRKLAVVKVEMRQINTKQEWESRACSGGQMTPSYAMLRSRTR